MRGMLKRTAAIAPVAATVLAGLAGALPAFSAARVRPVELIRGA